MNTNHFLQLHQPPFDGLTDEERSYLARFAKVSYLDNDTPVPLDWGQDFFVIIKGKLKQYQDNELIAGLNAGDWFTLVDTDGRAFEVITSEQSLLYRIDGNAVRAIADKNPSLKTDLFADFAERTQHYANRKAHYESQSLLYRTVGELGEYIRPPNFVPSDTTLYAATVAMNQANAKHILVQNFDVEDNPHTQANHNRQAGLIGIFTQTDVCRAIADKADFATTPVQAYTDFDIHCIDAEHDVSEALLMMLDKKVHRLPIVDSQDTIIGVLGQTALLNFLTNHSQIIFAKIEQAVSIEDIAAAVTMIGKFIRNQFQIGAKVQVIGRTVQSLNTQVFKKVWQLTVPAAVFENTCLLVMGSEGRGEQIMRTDQDNALIIRDGFDDSHLSEYANQFNDRLAALGYPYCDGKMMVNEPRWRLPLVEFQQQVNSWLLSADSQSMIYLATLLDSHFVCGDKTLLQALMTDLYAAYQSSQQSNFINRFALPTIQIGDSASFWHKFTGGQDADIDLKKAGIFPIVHGARTLALEHGIMATSTKARLKQLAQKHVIDDKTAQNLLEALDFFLTKRLEVALITEDKSARHVNPNRLSSLERDLLKESLAVVKNFKSLISHRYRLDIFGAGG